MSYEALIARIDNALEDIGNEREMSEGELRSAVTLRWDRVLRAARDALREVASEEEQLRDSFAAIALGALLEKDPQPYGSMPVVERAYGIADEMLAERAVTEQERERRERARDLATRRRADEAREHADAEGGRGLPGGEAAGAPDSRGADAHDGADRGAQGPSGAEARPEGEDPGAATPDVLDFGTRDGHATVINTGHGTVMVCRLERPGASEPIEIHVQLPEGRSRSAMVHLFRTTDEIAEHLGRALLRATSARAR